MRVHKHTTEHRRARVRQLTDAGYSSAEIGAQLDVNERTVQRDRQALGINLSRPRLTAEQVDRGLELLRDGSGYAEAARTIGCAASTLLRKFPGYGLTRAECVERKHMNDRLRRIEG